MNIGAQKQMILMETMSCINGALVMEGEGTWLLPGGESGEIYEVNHTWDEKGEYEIRVKAKDEHGAESEWSDPLPVSMPRNKLSTRHS